MSISKLWRKALFLVLLIILSLVTVTASSESLSSEDSIWKNYIIVVDNSGSNIAPTKALGAATDPNGLRFAACRLLYDQMLPENNRIGLIVFSGSGEYCSTFGPIERSSLAAQSLIRDQLNNPAVTDYRNAYTDIDYALNEALKMAASFNEGETAVILLTDGVNDLTNSATALTDQINLDANEKTVETVKRIAQDGHSFYIIALTAEGNADFRSTFMTFINRLGEAGGGVWEEDGFLNNVYEAQASNLGSAAIEIVGKQTGQIIDEKLDLYTPITDSFEIPNIGISEAGITISFSVNDKSRLRAVYLSDPNGTRYLIWENGKLVENDSSMFTIQEDINYFNIRIIDPATGNWFITVEGEEGTNIKRTLKLDQNVRLKMDVSALPNTVAPTHFRVFFQEYSNDTFIDVLASDLYSISDATLTLTTPSGAVQTHPLVNGTSSFDADLVLQEAGVWYASVDVRNEYLEKNISNYMFQVEEAVIPPHPPVGEVQISLIPIVDSEGSVFYIDRSAEIIELSWTCGNNDALTAFEIIENNKLIPIRKSEDADYCMLGADELNVGSVYTISVAASNADNTSTASASMQFALYPDPSELKGFALSCENLIDGEEANGLPVTRGETAKLRWNIESGDVTSILIDVTTDQGETNGYEIDPTQTSFTVPLKEGVITTIRAVPVPKYGNAVDGEQYASMLILTPKVLTFTEKLLEKLPLILGILGGVILLVIIIIVVRELTCVRLKGTLALKCSNADGFESLPIYIPLDGMKSGSPLNKKKRIKNIVDDVIPDAPFFTELCKIRLYKEHTDENGHLAAGLSDRTYLPDTAALKITLGADVLEFIDSNNKRCSFTAATPDGATFKFTCAYSDDNPFPII